MKKIILPLLTSVSTIFFGQTTNETKMPTRPVNDIGIRRVVPDNYLWYDETFGEGIPTDQISGIHLNPDDFDQTVGAWSYTGGYLEYNGKVQSVPEAVERTTSISGNTITRKYIFNRNGNKRVKGGRWQDGQVYEGDINDDSYGKRRLNRDYRAKFYFTNPKDATLINIKVKYIDRSTGSIIKQADVSGTDTNTTLNNLVSTLNSDDIKVNVIDNDGLVLIRSSDASGHRKVNMSEYTQSDNAWFHNICNPRANGVMSDANAYTDQSNAKFSHSYILHDIKNHTNKLVVFEPKNNHRIEVETTETFTNEGSDYQQSPAIKSVAGYTLLDWFEGAYDFKMVFDMTKATTKASVIALESGSVRIIPPSPISTSIVTPNRNEVHAYLVKFTQPDGTNTQGVYAFINKSTKKWQVYEADLTTQDNYLVLDKLWADTTNKFKIDPNTGQLLIKYNLLKDNSTIYVDTFHNKEGLLEFYSNNVALTNSSLINGIDPGNWGMLDPGVATSEAVVKPDNPNISDEEHHSYINPNLRVILK